MNWGSVTAPYWDDKPVLIVGGGASLAGFDLERLRGLGHVLAVKGSMFDIPWATAGFGLDLPRYLEWAHKLGDLPYPVYWAFPDDNPPHPKVANAHIPDNVVPLRRVRGDKLADTPEYVYNGGTSGFGALNLAVLKRARQICLFGFDFKQTTGEWHYNRKHYGANRVQNPIRWREWSKRFALVAEELRYMGIDVLNASPDSALPGFYRATLDDAVVALECGNLLGGSLLPPPIEEDPPAVKEKKLNRRGRPLTPQPGWVLG